MINPINITFISDTHNRQSAILPMTKGDIICHTGDISALSNEPSNYYDFLYWFTSLPFKHKVFIAGNHDRLLEEKHPEIMHLIQELGIHYLENESIILEGVKIYGSPLTPRFGRWYFIKDRNDLKSDWDKIPEDTQVLLTHGPPFGVGDLCNSRQVVGCKYLLDKVLSLPKLKYHAFGHVHEGRGLYYLTELGIDTIFVNCSIMNGAYMPIHQPYRFYINV